MDKRIVNDNLLIVDDDEIFRNRLVEAFINRGYTVRAGANTREALSILSEFVPTKAIIDIKMPGESGLSLLEQLMEKCPEVSAVILTGYGSIATAMEAVKLGAVEYLTKPVDVDRIIAGLNGVNSHNLPKPTEDNTPTLEQVEWDHIQRILADCNGNITHTAKALGIHRRSLQRKLLKAPGKDRLV